MIHRINNYLLTRYPLLWNTRLLWVAGVNVILHLLFLIGGLLSINAGNIANQYSVSSVSGGNHYSLSILCGLVVLIIWGIFYLRNNAFKSHYRIGKWYLAQEFAIICFIILSGITYFMSFEWGVKARVRSITNEAQMVQEINIVNKAAVYVPHEKASYFILNDCSQRYQRAQKNLEKNKNAGRQSDSGYDYEPEELNIEDSVGLYDVKNSAPVLAALRQPGAFSYLHQCSLLVEADTKKIDSSEAISLRNRQWLQQGRKDSIKASLQAFFAVLDKYRMKYRLNADSILQDVFSDRYFTMDAIIPNQPFKDVMGYQVGVPFYIDHQNVQNVFRFIEECQPGGTNRYDDGLILWNLVGYTAITLSIILLCYRRFSRKVFLISTIGTLVWVILFGLIAVSMRIGDGFSVLLLLLCGLFGSIGLWQIRQNRSKTLSGVLLNWHVYLAPYVVLLIVSLIISNYNGNYNPGYSPSNMSYDEYMQLNYPFGYWVKKHSPQIYLANLAVSFLYVALLFNNWAKRWQVMAEE